MESDQNILDPTDGGYSSRKWWYAVGTSCLIFATGALAGMFPVLRAEAEVVIGGLVSALAVYCGANVTSRWVTGKANNPAPQPDKARPRPPVEPLPEDQ